MSMDNVQDIYTLSPMQQGMLFHTLYDPTSGAYSVQTIFTVKGALDTDAFRRTWGRIVERHPILRTAFVWEGVEEPLQVVYAEVDLPMAEHDLRWLSGEAQEQQLNELLAADRAQSFDLTEPPLMRFALIRLAEQEYRFVWSIHHILVDGWSLPLLMTEFQAFYEAFRRGEDLYLPEPLPYGEYIGWLQEQDLAEVEAFWRRNLAGFAAPTPLGITRGAGAPAGAPEEYTEQETELSRELTTRLQSLAQQHGLTLNTVLQAAWGLILSKYSGEDDVLFGAVVSGRSVPLPGVEAMVGPFINTLPVRMTIDPAERLTDWWKRLQAQQFEARQYEFSPLVQVQSWSEVPRGTA
ncbi:MAG TPA: condensation domain-containing protein, partial [Symbiobacteriaceae bacterium]|nr:condensation domain-containing protein [Symbiobacteriaceae bacterium]